MPASVRDRSAAVLVCLAAAWVLAVPEAPAAEASTGEAGAFTRLDLPDAAIFEPKAPKETQPWILVVDDPQCPYCMQLHLALHKAKDGGDQEIARAVVVRVPFPLAYHDQAAHILMDALCLEASGAGRLWTAASYLDWLIIDPWKQESGWAGATLEDLERDGGFFDANYEKHKVTSSRRRDFQTERARLESQCQPASCAENAECEKLCTEQKTCREACPPAPAAAAGSGGTAGAGEGTLARDTCLADCSSRFVSTRYRQFSKSHSACLLDRGAHSAHARTATAFDWAVAHKVPGTPTVYVGHPTTGFRPLGDSDHLSEFLVLLRQGLAETRAAMARAAGVRPG